MNQSGRMNWILIAVLLVIILGLLVTLLLVIENGREPARPDSPSTTESTPDAQTGTSEQLEIERIEEQGDSVVVITNFCRVKYPYAFSDLVQVEQINSDEKVALRFYAVINGKRMDLYELVFGGEGNLQVGALIRPYVLEPMLVYAEIFSEPSDLKEDERIAFIAARETFDDVVNSLQENELFVPVA